MKLRLFCHLLVLWGGSLMAQTMTMTTVNGGTNTDVVCSGTFYDGGGAAGAYSSTPGVYTQVFTPTTATSILHLTVASINLIQGGSGTNDDDMQVYLGVGTGGTMIYDAPADMSATDVDFYGQVGGSITVVFTQNGTNNGSAPGWSATIDCIETATTPVTSNTTINTTNTYFTDPGGLAGNMDGGVAASGTGYYPNSAGNYYTICPETPGTYVSINFLDFRIETGYESLVILDGGISGGIIGSYTGATSPGTITSSSPDGCLTLWFNGDASFTAPGWLAYITNSVTRGSNTYCCETYNCSGGCGIWICVSGEFEPNTGGGQGCVEDMRIANTQGCLSTPGEVNSTWYYFSPEISGTLGFIISPPGGLDFDYAIWKSPTDGAISCPLNTNEPPIRCSFAAANGNIGLDFTSVDLSEGAGGDNFTRYMDVIAGETYMMMLNCFSNGNPQANPLWTWTGTATLSCTPVSGVLDAGFMEFYGVPSDLGTELIWRTSTEIASTHFEIHRGTSPSNMEAIGQVPANQAPSRYSFMDERLPTGTYYYKVVEYDAAGHSSQTQVIEIRYDGSQGPAQLVKIINLLGVDVTDNPPHNQVLIKVYDDGRNEKYLIHD
jgi:hypothetical protein